MLRHVILMGLLLGPGDSGASDCRLIDDDAKRLACYDAQFGRPSGTSASPTPISTAPGAGSAARSPVAADSNPPVAKERDFGLTEAQRNQRDAAVPAAVHSIESIVVNVERLPYDRFVVVLENGQRWAQVDPTPRQRFFVGDPITIRSAALDSYLAVGPKSGTSIRVRRLD